MNPFWTAFWFVIAFVLAVFLVASMISPVGAQSLHDRHDEGDPGHWYDLSCCNLRDCRPISGVRDDGTPWSEVRQTDEGYEWHSSLSGKIHKIPASGWRRKPSRDGRYHGCESPYDGSFMCFYEPLFF